MGSLRSWELVLSQRWVSFLVLVYSFMKPVADVVFLKAGVYRSVGEELCLEGGLYRKGAESDTRYVSCFALIYDHMRSIRRLFVPLFTCLLSESVRVEITCDGLARFRLGRGENIHRQNYVCRCRRRAGAILQLRTRHHSVKLRMRVFQCPVLICQILTSNLNVLSWLVGP